MFGAGDYGHQFATIIEKEIKVIGYIDNDKAKQGNIINGYYCYTLDDVLDDYRNYGIIVTVSQIKRAEVLEVLNTNGLFHRRYYFTVEEFLSIYYVYKYDMVYFSSISFLPSTVCNLKCNACLNFNTYAKKFYVRDFDDITKDIDLFFSCVDRVMLFHVSGGEPFLYPHIAEVIGYIDNYYGKSIDTLRTVTKSKKYHIVLMVVNPSTDKRIFDKLEGIGNVLTSLEIENMSSTCGIDYECVENCKTIQLHVEQFLYRFTDDYQLNKYRYYTALSFWNNFFNNNKVDIVINTMMWHGHVWDIPNELAILYGVKSFFIEQCGYNDTYTITRVRDRKLMGIFSHGADSVEYLLEHIYDTSGLHKTANKSILRKITYYIGGNLLEDFVCRLIGFKWESRSLARRIEKAYWSDKFKGYIKLLMVKKYLRYIENSPDFSEKYIFFALHYEPEAVIQARTIMESQLVVIKMLSESIPDDWKIYPITKNRYKSYVNYNLNG